MEWYNLENQIPRLRELQESHRRGRKKKTGKQWVGKTHYGKPGKPGKPQKSE
jgi:hypothetical protein